MKSFSFICEIGITIVLLFLTPLLYFEFQKEFLLQGQIRYQVIYFTDSARNTGYISKNSYEAFKVSLEKYNHVYDIRLSVYHKYSNTGAGDGFYLGTYTEEIVKQLYEKGEWYTMHQGDFLTVSVSRKDTSALEKMLQAIGIGNGLPFNIPIQYGGMIRDECF